MTKFKVSIKRVEYYSGTVIVEAENAEQAKAKVEDAWQKDTALYEDVTDNIDDSVTDFTCQGEAVDKDERKYDHIEKYLQS